MQGGQKLGPLSHEEKAIWPDELSFTLIYYMWCRPAASCYTQRIHNGMVSRESLDPVIALHGRIMAKEYEDQVDATMQALFRYDFLIPRC